MKVGLYFGSFNPVHVGHLIIANHVVEHCNIDQVWFVVSPQNPLKKSAELLNEYHRLHLVQLAVDQNTKFKVSDVEFKLPKPSYTIDTLAYLHEKYPKNTFTVIMGSDSYQNLPKWKNYALLVRDASFIVYERPGFSMPETIPSNVQLVKAPFLDIAATLVRSTIRSGKSIAYLVPDAVREEIEKNGYYRT